MKPLPGFRDLFPEDMARRSYLVGCWRETARRYGFVEFDGPTLETAELYRKKNSGGEILGQLYGFIDKGEREVALRPEVTPTLARMVAARHREYAKPLRWFNVGTCFRYERPQRGRLREFLQFNCDLLGDASPAADAEVIALLIDLLRSFGLNDRDFFIRVSSRSIWSRFLSSQGLDSEQTTVFLSVIDKLAWGIDPDLERNKLAPFGISHEAIDAFIKQREEQITEFEPLLNNLRERGLQDYVVADLTVVRGLAYYTGIVFEAVATRGGLRAIAGGGRYDRLLADLSDGDADLPAVGFGIGDAVLLELLRECPDAAQQEAEALKADAPVQVYLVIADENKRAAALRLAQKLRNDGWRVAFPLGVERVGKQFGAAESAGATHAVVIGAEWPLVKVKHLASRTEEEVPQEALAEWLKAHHSSSLQS